MSLKPGCKLPVRDPLPTPGFGPYRTEIETTRGDTRRTTGRTFLSLLMAPCLSLFYVVEFLLKKLQITMAHYKSTFK